MAGFLALAVAALTSRDAQTVRAVYVAMELTGWLVLVPLSVASLLTGLVPALGSRWGLLRHYWVVVKLGLTVLATVVLLMYTRTLGALADRASEPTTSGAALGDLRSASPALHAGAALLLLLAATVLAVFKPPGITRYGRAWYERRGASRP